ncbi:MAG TPA: phenylalanine--tRNA ligase subunit beta [Phycisphaerales bacterium]|nr:phenylalanine--tRNA ligase subunit beta [Phycisphaerales bacterium]HMP37899.1 phenylalanine--tRNA ligase subunit beta [Phycisphaerales bacterium]
MRTSVNWINDYLDRPADADEQAELLTRAGLPFDGREALDGDTRQEIETTSNRGDCLSHVGLAREIAALSGRRLRLPAATPSETGPRAEEITSVVNERPDLCARYVARVILGATVRPSPPWLADRLRAIGQIPRSNIVDATNYVLFELGQPTHVFDLDALRGRRIVIRMARTGERFLPLGDGAEEIGLDPADLVIADAERPVALAGIKGGAASAVREGTTDLLLESASFDPVTIRRTGRRLRIASDSSHRFERGVHPAQVEAASRRLAALILEVAGGTLCAGSVDAGAPLPPPRRIELRTARCRRLLGVAMPLDRMMTALDALGFAPRAEPLGDGDAIIACTVPAERIDIEREVDLVEEVARMIGLDALPVTDTIAVRLADPSPAFAARRVLRDALAGMEFVECVTHSLVAESAAAAFLPEPSPSGAAPGLLRVEDERARAEPILRPSLVPSLLKVRRHNLDHGVSSLRLFEVASVFHLPGAAGSGGAHAEREVLALVADVASLDPGPRPETGRALRALRGIVERLVALTCGHEAAVRAEATERGGGWLSTAALLLLDCGEGGREVGGDRGRRDGAESEDLRRSGPKAIDGGAAALGIMGPVRRELASGVGIDVPLVAAEIELRPLLERFPPSAVAAALPAFPAIERDVSVIVAETITWDQLRAEIASLRLSALEALEFVTVFRGKPIPEGRKSTTFRLRFRAADRTLRGEEVDSEVELVLARLRSAVAAEIRS